ncbi:MAG: peptidoglycan-binding protein, partial [Pseudomonadota bacterium]
MTEWGLSDVQIATIDAIVSVFESGGPGDYGAIARAKDDRGGLSYGKHQASLTSGSLSALLTRYVEAAGALYTNELQKFMPQIAAGDRALDTNNEIYDLLKAAANDPVMQSVQDEYFTEHYMAPALRKWRDLGFQHPLSAGIVYDSFIHSGRLNMQARTEARMGPPNEANEKAWIKAYAEERRNWLATHSNTILHATAIRMDAFLDQIDKGNWSLSMPVDIRRPRRSYPLTPYDLGAHLFGDDIQLMDPETFGEARANAASNKNGRDRFLQDCLAKLGFLSPSGVDGAFGPGTERAVKAFQAARGLD